MELLLNRTSPYARIARVVALEKGCADKLVLVRCVAYQHWSLMTATALASHC
jgi:hypothetical protein